jgi:hypothetical protein
MGSCNYVPVERGSRVGLGDRAAHCTARLLVAAAQGSAGALLPALSFAHCGFTAHSMSRLCALCDYLLCLTVCRVPPTRRLQPIRPIYSRTHCGSVSLLFEELSFDRQRLHSRAHPQRLTANGCTRGLPHCFGGSAAPLRGAVARTAARILLRLLRMVCLHSDLEVSPAQQCPRAAHLPAHDSEPFCDGGTHADHLSECPRWVGAQLGGSAAQRTIMLR